MNSRLYIDDDYFALDDGLLPPDIAQGSVKQQFFILAQQAGLVKSRTHKIYQSMLVASEKVMALVQASFLSDSIKYDYWQNYKTRLIDLSEQ